MGQKTGNVNAHNSVAR